MARFDDGPIIIELPGIYFFSIIHRKDAKDAKKIILRGARQRDRLLAAFRRGDQNAQ